MTVDASYIRASGYEMGYHYVKCAKIDEYANVKNKKKRIPEYVYNNSWIAKK